MDHIKQKYKELLALNIPDIKVFPPMTEDEIAEFCEIRKQQFGIIPSREYCDLLRIAKGASWYDGYVELNLADPENLNKEERWNVGSAFQNALVIYNHGNGNQYLVDIKPDGSPGHVLGWQHETPALTICWRDLGGLFQSLIDNWNHPDNPGTAPDADPDADPDEWIDFAIFNPIDNDDEIHLSGTNMTVDFETAIASPNPAFREFAKQAGDQYYFVDWSAGEPGSGADIPRKWFDEPSIRSDENGLMFGFRRSSRKPSFFDRLLGKLFKIWHP